MRVRTTYLEPAYLETLALAMAAGALLQAALFSLQAELADWPAVLRPWIRDAGTFRLAAAAYGTALAAAAIASVLAIRTRGTSLSTLCLRRGRAVAAEARAAWRWLAEAAALREALPWLLAMTAVAAAVRAYFLAQPIRYDEAYTYLNFAGRKVADLFYYPLPNNHVLHTLLVRASVEILGIHPVAIRLPAFAASLGTVPLTFCVARLVTGGACSGFAAAGLAAVFPYLVLFGTVARGHSLLLLFVLALTVLAFRLTERPSANLGFLIALTTASGLLVIPTFLLPAAGIFAWAAAVLLWRSERRAEILVEVLLPCGVLTAALAAVAYTPTLVVSRGIRALSNTLPVASLPGPRFLAELPGHAAATASRFVRDVPDWMLAAALLAAALGVYRLARRPDRRAAALFPALVLGGLAVVAVKQAIPIPRVWIYLLPFAFVLVDAGLAALARTAAAWVKAAALALACGTAALLAAGDVIASYSDHGRFPEAPVLVDVLAKEMRPGDRVAAGIPASSTVRFYLRRRGLPRPGDGGDARTFFVVVPRVYGISKATGEETRKLIEVGDAALYVTETAAGAPVIERRYPWIRLLD